MSTDDSKSQHVNKPDSGDEEVKQEGNETQRNRGGTDTEVIQRTKNARSEIYKIVAITSRSHRKVSRAYSV
jgi:hypothetical protein